MGRIGQIPWNKGKKEKRIEVLIKQSNSHKGKHPSEETKNKMSLSRIGKPNSSKSKFQKGHKINCGRVHNEESKINMALSKTGKICKPETKIKISLSQKGRKVPEERKKKMSLSHIGKKLSEENRLLAIKNLKPNPKGSTLSEETKRKIREKRKNQSPVYTSTIENKIRNFLKELKIEYNQHKYINIEHGYQCDIFVPSKNLVIECDGDYWHGNPSIYPAESLTERQKERKLTDSIRTKELFEQGFKVLRLWESEIKKMNLEDFKERLGKV